MRIKTSTANISHANLIVEDRTGLLRTTARKDFYRIYFPPELVDAIVSSPFREIYLVTMLEGEQVFAPLKMLHLLAESFYFSGTLETNGLTERIPERIDELELFAAYLNSVVEAPVLVHRASLGTEIIFGDSGLVLEKDNSISVRLHSDFPVSKGATAPSVDWQSILGVRFQEAMKEFRASNSFSTDAVVPVNKREGDLDD